MASASDATISPIVSDVGHTDPHLRECRGCGLIQTVPPLFPGARAACPRCAAVLREVRRDPFNLTLALHVAGLILFCVGSTLTLLSVASSGHENSAALFSGPVGLEHYGMWLVAAIVGITTIAIPAIRLTCMIVVLIGLRLTPPPAWLRGVFALAEHLRPWSMVEIYLLGLFVAYVKLGDLVHIEIGNALYALGALTVAMVAADVAVDDQAVWERLHQAPDPAPARARSASALGARLVRIGCDTCGLVSLARDGTHCRRCGFRLHHRKPYSIAWTWALSLAALILYIPANVYPVLTVVRLGRGNPSTILGGVQELLAAGMWPLALLVFVASILVPVVKLICLGILLVTTQIGTAWRLKERTVLYRMVDWVGRWSMIDIFMVSLLVALVQLGGVSTVRPGAGATAFASVVILTMFAAQCFDPRLMWDAAEPPARPAGRFPAQSAAGHPAQPTA